jgi:nucleotide-binding universal stress UspA family protein
LAILAFEEAGKGHRYELDIEKSKRARTWHIFRQIIAAFVLNTSFAQKYGLTSRIISPKLQKLMEDRWKDTKVDFESPIPEEIRQEMREALLPDMRSLSDDQLLVASVEGRWVKKILIAAASEKVEILRQQGMYVDLDGNRVVSEPSKVALEEAVHWIRIAERVVKILEFGDYQAPYGELAAVLESMPKPLPEGPALLKLLEQLQEDARDALLEIQSSNSPISENP